jgi:hypothetical protein
MKIEITLDKSSVPVMNGVAILDKKGNIISDDIIDVGIDVSPDGVTIATVKFIVTEIKTETKK